MNKRRYVVRSILVVLIAIILEIIVFNFNSVMLFLNRNYDKNIEYSIKKSELINIQSENGGYVTALDPIIIYNNLNLMIKNIKFIVKTDKDNLKLTMFYTNDKITQFSAEGMIELESQNNNGEYYTNLDGSFKDIRIDPGEEADIFIKDFIVIINSCRIEFSISRVIAIYLIYFVGLVLFALQKKSNYSIE